MSSGVIINQKAGAGAGRDILRLLSFLSIAFGIFVSGYLSYTQATASEMVCIAGGMFDCGVVQNSVYARFLGIQVAYLGLGTYLVLGTILLLERRISLLADYGPALFFGITLFAFVFSMWLVYAQVFLLQALCPWCLAHEVNITVLLVLAGLRLRQAMA